MNKRIKFNRDTKDFAAYVGEALLGFFATNTEAERACDEFVFSALTHGGNS